MAARVGEIFRTYEDFDYEDLILYAGVDCVATSELLAAVFPRIVERPEYFFAKSGKITRGRAPSILSSIESVGRKAFEFIIDMELNGILYDVARNRSIADQMVSEIAGLEEGIFSKIGSIDLNSGKVMSEFLYERRGFPILNRTKKGEPSVDGDTLKELAKKTGEGWLYDLGKRNDIVSVYRTFIAKYVEEHVKRDGRVHPSYNLTGTSSFRITGEHPNLTQLPRPKWGYNVRECFTVGPGKIFITFDYSSCEVKVLGAICKDPKLLAAIRAGRDFHSVSAAALMGMDYEEFVAIRKNEEHPRHKEIVLRRQAAKALTFGILYGSTVRGIALGLKIPESEAQELINMYFKEYPLIKEYVNDTHLMARYNHFVFTPFGQRKQEFGTLPPFEKSAVYNAALRNSQNVLIQSTASTLGLDSFSSLNEAIKPLGARTLCTVYDSIEIEAPIGRAAEVIELGFKYMDDLPVEKYDWLDCPIGCDAEIGTNWGTLKEVKRGIRQTEIEDILANLKEAA